MDDTYDSERQHIRAFAKQTMDDLMADLTRFYGERPGDPQRNALHNIVWAMTCLADRRDYRELESYSRDEIYGGGDNMAPGGLFLAARMCRGLDLGIGDRINSPGLLC